MSHAGLTESFVNEVDSGSFVFNWYGSWYTQNDLAEALAVISGPEGRVDQLSNPTDLCRSSSCWVVPVWQQAFNADAQFLLETLLTDSEVSPAFARDGFKEP